MDCRVFSGGVWRWLICSSQRSTRPWAAEVAARRSGLGAIVF